MRKASAIARHNLSLSQGIPNIELQRILLASEGPLTHATKADYVKFHDDKVGRPVRAYFVGQALHGPCRALGSV